VPAGSAAPGNVRTRHNQSVIIQGCKAEPLRLVRPGAFIDMKVCPDPCDSVTGLCPITMADRTELQTFGKCKTIEAHWLIATDRCDLEVVEAGWNDPHAPAPHDLATPSGADKRVFNLYYRAAWPSVACPAGQVTHISPSGFAASRRPSVEHAR
jgi:hypothetical protein